MFYCLISVVCDPFIFFLVTEILGGGQASERVSGLEAGDLSV